jgi:putative membrane protein
MKSMLESKLLLAAAIAAGLATLSACGHRDDNDVPATDGTAAADTAPADGTSGAAPADGTTGASGTPGAPADTAGALPATGVAGGTPADAGMVAERSALGLLNAINSHEIAAGRQALDKGVSGDVAAFAQMMIDQHTENREQTAAFDPDENSTEAQAQKAKGEQELATLAQKSGDDYARAYVDAMVKGHTEALAALDNRIIPAATRAEVRTHLASTREHVAQHLERAKALQGK